MTPTLAAILAGGRSERMGRDKAEIVWQGETLLERTARVAREAGCRVVIVGRERPDTWPQADTVFLTDAFPHQGPLGGLATALQLAEATGEQVLALACDMPRLTTDALRWLLSHETGSHGVAVRNGEQWEPLFSLYAPDTLPLIQRQLQAGRRSLHSLLAAGDFQAVTLPSPLASALKNANTPEDLAALSSPD